MNGNPNATFTPSIVDITNETDVVFDEMNSRYKVLIDNDSIVYALLVQHTTQLAALQGQVGTLQQQLSTAQTQIITLQQQVADLQNDTTPPSVTLVSSSSNVNAASSVTLTATASDPSGIQKVEFYRNGTKIGEDLTAPYALQEDYTPADNGTLTYFARAIDTAGNPADSNSVTVTVAIPTDTSGPTVALTIDKTYVLGAEETLGLHATATDPSGIDRVEFYRNGVLDATATTFPYRHTRTYTLADGSGNDNWTAKAFDQLGNSTLSAIRIANFNMGISGPGEAPEFISMVSNNGMAGSIFDLSDIPLQAEITDDVAVTWVDFYFKRNQMGSWEQISGTNAPTSGNLFEAEMVTSLNGARSAVYEFFARARDVAGNATSSYVTRQLVLIPDDAGRPIYQGTETNPLPAAPGGFYKSMAFLEGNLRVPTGCKLYITGDHFFKYTPDPAYLGPAEIEVAFMDYDPAGDLVRSRITVLNHNTNANTSSETNGSGDILIYHNTSGATVTCNLYINIKNPQSAGGSSVKGTVTYDAKLKLST